MEKLKCILSNCYGIEKLDYEFNFSRGNVITIYARNGLMKTSFSKTFKKIQNNKVDEIRDEIFNKDGNADVKSDGKKINPSSIFVIKSFEGKYESESVADLLVDDNIKRQIVSILKQRDKVLKDLEKNSGLKIFRTLGGKKVYELEPTIVEDLNLKEESFLLNLKEIKELDFEYDFSHIKYSIIFDNTVQKKIVSSNFQNKIDEFCEASKKIYQSYTFFDLGKFNLPKLKNVEKILKNDNFFIKDNYIHLDGGIKLNNVETLSEKIQEIEAKIKQVPALQEIEKLLSDAKGITLRDTIENNPEIVPYLKKEKLSELKKQLWVSYFNKIKDNILNLYNQYIVLEKNIDNINIEDTLWSDALKIFEERFTVPYKMRISNIKSVIIGESLPRVEFSFKKNNTEVSLERNELEEKDVLSQGEKRALYLLNIIFDVEKIKK